MADTSKPKKEADLDNQDHGPLMSGGSMMITPNPIPLAIPSDGNDSPGSYRAKGTRRSPS
jgi:hypothetical protein